MRTLILLLLLSPHLPSAQNSPPGQKETSGGGQKQSRGSRQPASPDRRGTEDAPFVVRSLPTPKTQEEAAEEAKERDEKTANDRKLVQFTRQLVVATGVLGAIGFLQLLVFGLQAVQLQRTVQAAKESSDALANIERPWLLVTDKGHQFKFVGGKNVPVGHFQVKNYGKSPAWIVEIGGTLETLNNLTDLAAEPVYKDTAKDEYRAVVLIPSAMDAEAQYTYSFAHTSPSADYGWQRVVQTGDAIWCIYGFVRYTDIFEKTHETRFSCKLDKSAQWKPVDAGANYNRHS
jgi:hypothetical protein